MSMLGLIGRQEELFVSDILKNEKELSKIVSNSSFLVIGGAGSIGQAVCKEIFKRNPKKLHIVDISENNLVEVVRDIRSSSGYIDGDFRSFALDCGSLAFDVFFQAQSSYDYVLNLSALKHVRSEKDPYTLMRMIDVNILNTEKTMTQALDKGAKKYFCVSTDKAANPVNMMGASKRIMEFFLMRMSKKLPVSTARFANVAFSDGSLLHGFNQRLQKRQPISAPKDIKRYFVTPKESGELCLMSCIFGDNRDIFFPKLDEKLNLTTFSDIAIKYLNSLNYEAYQCSSEDEARSRVDELVAQKKWPCYFFDSDTTGEKDFEEFYTDNEILDMNRFESIGIIKNDAIYNECMLNIFLDKIAQMKNSKNWTRHELVELFNKMIPNFNHKETGKFLDNRM
ncbi:UDP-N-acetylglucosamine 4,6-dehydratase [Campylobacter geochelonis]|uniref:UDP-N-acetylglucosamine 4,6-dehydratase n=1 Tax=Campylobacter geochelonis TaxID=1780362 RepID=UPI00077096FA|nr:UDP-N-acetylglucosamine 4,6-dehydratase [Campylobacter geochelonis]CZE49306.1 putative epimerase/dehydratase WbiI [Campylobacter geochelonis]CZE51418.1 putative epimerase/dehydratase WbiI [Campylobacter geochelonis]